MSLLNDIKSIQKLAHVRADGIFGPITARAVLDALRDEQPVVYRPGTEIDDRTAKNIGTLLERARAPFEKFYRLANATAASMGCEYVAISGNRTWDEQAALYAKGRTKPGKRVTNARPGSSWHNFGVALDFGVFKDGKYLDNADPKLARRVHVACSKHAEACGLTWGGNWKSFKDIPHYQLKTGVKLSQARKLYQEGRWA